MKMHFCVRTLQLRADRLHRSSTSSLAIFLVAICLTVASMSWVEGKSPLQDPDPSGAISLFDGTSLNGWSGDPRYWTVENGAITGTTTAEQPLDANSFLIWRNGEIDDFELRIKFRIEGGNSGVQYRSRDMGDHHVGGYQADIDADHTYIGILYDELGRGILANRATRVEIDELGNNKVVGTTSDEAALLASIKQNEWSEYTITARGNHLTQTINGFVTVDIVDGQVDQAETRGILALQIHAGPPMKVQFKDVYLRRLNSPQATPGVAASPSSEACCPAPNCFNRCPPKSRCCTRLPILGGFFRR